MNTSELTKYKNKYLKEVETPKDHPKMLRTGKFKGTLFEDLVTKPQHLKYVKFLLFGKVDKTTRVFEEDREAFSRFLSDKAVDSGMNTIATNQQRFIEVFSPQYLKGYTFYFGKHKGKTLEVVLKEDKEYIDWLLRSGLEKDFDDNYWNTEAGIDLQCILKVVNN